MYRIEKVTAGGKTRQVRKWRSAEEARVLAQRRANEEGCCFIVTDKDGQTVYEVQPQ